MRPLLAFGLTCAFFSSPASALEVEELRQVSDSEGENESASAEAVAPEAATEGSEERDPDGEADRVAAPSGDTCLRDPVTLRHLRRPREVARLSLTHCDGTPNLDALRELSFVARAWQTPRPTEAELQAYREAHPERAERWMTPQNRWLHPGLLVRLQAISDRWPTRDLVVVSGHRPNARRNSRHRFGRALDLQVDGVERAEVAAFAQSLARTGVGYYPNSSFTHVDVRETSVYWVDRSGPGQRPDYGPWPPTEDESDAHGREVLAQVEGALGELRVQVPGAASTPLPTPPAPAPVPPAIPPAPVARRPERPSDPEAERIRREAFAAIEALRRRTEPTRVSDVVTSEDAIDWTVPF